MEEYGGTVTDASSWTEAGVPMDLWRTWSSFDQDLYRQDYMRTDAQKNYVDIWASDWRNSTAYVYTAVVDHYTGLDSADVGATTNDAYATFRDASQDSYDALVGAKDQAVGIAILLGLGYIATR